MWRVVTEVPADLSGGSQTSRNRVVGRGGLIPHPQQLPALQSPPVRDFSQVPLGRALEEAVGWGGGGAVPGELRRGSLGDYQGSWAALFSRSFSCLRGRKRGWLYPLVYRGWGEGGRLWKSQGGILSKAELMGDRPLGRGGSWPSHC